MSNGKSKKHGRNKESCKAYRAGGRYEANKVRRLVATLKRSPYVLSARYALDKIRPDLVKKLDAGTL